MSGWPRKSSGREYRNCNNNTCSTREKKFKALCYAQDNTEPDSFNTDQYCAYEDDEGTRFPLSEGCCSGKDIPKDKTDGPMKIGCPGQCDNVKNPRAPQGVSTGKKDSNNDNNEPSKDTQNSKYINVILVWILILIIMSSIAYLV